MSSPDSLEKTCLDTVERYGMLRGGGLVAVGVSGGADSVALLHFLHSVAPVYGLRLVAAHLNHKLRGAESDRDENFVRELCRRLEIPLSVDAADIADMARLRGQSVEECARDERYALFRRISGPDGRIATAHTLDDSAETMLLNLARGSALRGLCGIPPVRLDKESGAEIIRPLIGCTRRQIEEYCAANGLEYVTDSTNLSGDYARNRLRHQAIPAMASVNPAFLRVMAGTADSLRTDADFLDGLAGDALERIRFDGGCDAAGLLALAEPLRRRAILLLLAERDIPADRGRIMQLEGLLRKGGRLRLSEAWYAVCAGAELRLTSAAVPEPEEMPALQISLPEPGAEVNLELFFGKSLSIRCTTCKNFEETINNARKQFKNSLDYDRINKIVSIRPRMPGDQVRLAGRGCTKMLKKLYNEAGIPLEERGRRIVLDDGGGPVWLEGFGSAERACAGPRTERLLTLIAYETKRDEHVHG